jgi:ABC-type sugar transport system permease subunit
VRRRNLWGLAFVSPGIIYLLVILIGPLLFGLWISTQKWNPIADLSTAKWVGLANYKYSLTLDQRFLPSLKNSGIYALSRLGTNLVIGLGIALLMNSRRLRGLRAWRIALFLPMATSPVVIAKIWTSAFHKDFGALNVFLNALGLPSLGWLNPDLALLSVIIMGTYQFTGYYAIILLAALQGIPDELIDAAKVDGASGLRMLWHITLPLLRPVIAFVVVMSTISGLQVFDLVYASTDGGPADATLTTVLYMYRTVFVYGRAGQGAAMAFVLFAIIMVLAVFQLRLLRHQD